MLGFERSRHRWARHNSLLLVSVFLVVVLLGLSVVLAGCGSTTATSTTQAAVQSTTTSQTAAQPAEGTFPVTLTDDTGQSVTINTKPQRIVSTAPSNTEILFALGVGDRVVGVTSLDDYPPEVKGLPKVGDFQVNPEAVAALNPDLVVGYSGNEEALAQIKSKGVPVIITNPASLDDIYKDIQMIGAATGATGKAEELVASLQQEIKAIADKAAATGEKPRVFYALDNTLWTAGPGSFVDELLKVVGAENVGSSEASSAAAKQYYQFTPEQLVAADPDLILLPNTAYTSAEEFTSDSRFANLRAVKNGRVIVINDVIITRPGPRIAEGLKTLAAAVHPGASF